MSSGTNKQRILQNNNAIGTNNSLIDDIKTTINNLPSTGSTTAEASDILLNKTAVSKGRTITGTLGTESKNVKSTTTQQTITPTTGKLINEVIVEPIDLETKNVTLTLNSQTITPSVNKDGISQVNVEGVSSYLTTQDLEITENGTLSIGAGAPYFGFSRFNILVNVPTGGETGGDQYISKIKMYDNWQDKDNALYNDFLCIGDIGVIFENKIIEQLQYQQPYLALKFVDEIDPNYIITSSYQGNLIRNFRNDSRIQFDVAELSDIDPSINATLTILMIDTQQSLGYTLQVEYEWGVNEYQEEVLKRKKVQIVNLSTDEVVATADKDGVIFLPDKFLVQDYNGLTNSWANDVMQGVRGAIRDLAIYSGNSWSSAVD